MKREVASSLVERGVAERVRLTQAYEKKKNDLQKHHDIVKTQLNDHKEKVLVSFTVIFLDGRSLKEISLFLCFSFVVVFFFVSRQGHYLKKKVNLGHVSRPIVFWCYSIKIMFRKRPRKMVDPPMKILVIPKQTHKFTHT